ncbi:hypothetical protein IJT17_00655 [bacterium]|nr:hypothetical protein [bacterium]
MSETGGASSGVEVKVVFKADVSELEEAKKSLGSFDSSAGSDTSGLDDAADAAENAEEKLDELSDSSEEAGEKLSELGESAEEAAEGLEALDENTETAGENLGALGEQADEASQNLDSLCDSAGEAADSLSDANGSAEEIGSALDELGDSAEATAERISAVSEAAEETADEVENAGSAAEQISGSLDSASESANKTADSLKDVGESVKDTADSLSGTGESVQGLSDSLSAIGEATEETSESLSSVSEAGEDANDRLSSIGVAAEEAGESISQIGEAGEEAADNIGGIGEATEVAGEALGSLGDNAGEAADQIGEVGASGQDAADDVEEIGSASGDASAHLEKIIGLLEQIAAKLDNAGSATGEAKEEVEEAGEAAGKSADTFKDFSEALGKFENLGNGLKGISAGLIGIGKSAIDTAGEFEQLRAKLVTIQKSTEAANDTFEYAKTLAASTPFDVKSVVNAAVQLEVYGQESKDLLPVVAHLASAMGGDLSAAATAMGRALSGSSEGLQSLRDVFGVSTDKLVKFGATLNKQGGVAVDSAENIEKLKKALVGLVNAEFDGGIERQAKTITGAMGQIEDQITNTKAAIGDVFAPYVSVISDQLANLLEKLQGFAPAIAVFGGLAAATTGLAGTFIVAAVSVAGMSAAIKALSKDFTELKTKYESFKAANANFVSGAKLAGGISLGITALLALKEISDVVTEKIINNEKKAQAEIAAQSKSLVQQRQRWDDLRHAIERATKAKIRFNGKDTSPDAVDAAKALEGMSGAQIQDAVGAGNVEKLRNAAAQHEKELKEVQNNLNKAKEEYKKTIKEIEELKAALEIAKSDPEFALQYSVRLHKASKKQLQLEKDIKEFTSREAQLKDEAPAFKTAVDKLDAAPARLELAQKTAAADLDFANFAAKAKDADALYTAIERMRGSLASLYKSAEGELGLSPSDLKDTTAVLTKMGDLARQGQQDGVQYRHLKAILDQQQALEDTQKKLGELHKQNTVDKDIKNLDDVFAYEQAGRDRDLKATEQHLNEKLDHYRRYRQALAKEAEDGLAKGQKSGFLPGEQEYWQKQYADAQLYLPEELDLINQRHETRKNLAVDSFDNLITPLRDAAEELSSKVTANPADQVAAWKLVVDKAKEWGQTNADILAQSPELKRQFEGDLKAIEKEYKQVQEAAANTVLTNLAEKVSEKISSVSSSTAQLEAIRESERLYQQTLRTSKELQASDAARQQAQKQLNSLKQQELKILEQIKEMQKQVENETASLGVQIEEEKLAALQDRAQAGEDVSKQILAQEQKIHDMRLQMLEDAKKQELDAIVENSKEAARLRLSVEMKYQNKVTLLNMQFQRKLTQEQRSLSGSLKTGKVGGGSSGDKAKPAAGQESTWKPGSPLMTMQEAISSHNQWFASAGSDFLKDVSVKTNEMGTAAEQTSAKLLKLASSADAAASGLTGAKHSSAASGPETSSISAGASAPGSGGYNPAALWAAWESRPEAERKKIELEAQAWLDEQQAIKRRQNELSDQDWALDRIKRAESLQGFDSVLPSAGSVSAFPSAGNVGATVLAAADANSSAAMMPASVSQSQTSTYNLSFGGQASSGNAVDVQQVTAGAAKLAIQKIRRSNRANALL